LKGGAASCGSGTAPGVAVRVRARSSFPAFRQSGGALCAGRRNAKLDAASGFGWGGRDFPSCKEIGFCLFGGGWDDEQLADQFHENALKILGILRCEIEQVGTTRRHSDDSPKNKNPCI